MKPLILLLIVLGALPLRPDELRDFYVKNREIILPAAPEFGTTDWESLGLQATCRMASANGFIFVSDHRAHCIYKFTANGDLVSTFGRYGQGPGDLETPGEISIPDQKTVAVFNHGGDRRLSLFNIDGRYIGGRRFPIRIFNCLALREDLAAVIYQETRKKNVGNVCFLDVNAEIRTFGPADQKGRLLEVLQYQRVLLLDGITALGFDHYKGCEIIAAAPNGDLLAGQTTSDRIKRIAPDGTVRKVYQLKISPVPVTGEFMALRKTSLLKSFRERSPDEETYQRFARMIRRADMKLFFAEHLPLYSFFLMDPKERLLVFKHTATENGDETFQVYNPDGSLLCENRIRNGNICFKTSPSRQNLAFAGMDLILLAEQSNGPDDHYARLLRISTGPSVPVAPVPDTNKKTGGAGVLLRKKSN